MDSKLILNYHFFKENVYIFQLYKYFFKEFLLSTFFPVFFLVFFSTHSFAWSFESKNSTHFFSSTHTKIIVFYNLLTFVSKWATTTILHLNLRFALVWLTAFFMWCIWKLDELFLLFSSLGFFLITTHSLVFGLSPFLSHFSNTPNNF